MFNWKTKETNSLSGHRAESHTVRVEGISRIQDGSELENLFVRRICSVIHISWKGDGVRGRRWPGRESRAGNPFNRIDGRGGRRRMRGSIDMVDAERDQGAEVARVWLERAKMTTPRRQSILDVS